MELQGKLSSSESLSGNLSTRMSYNIDAYTRLETDSKDAAVLKSAKAYTDANVFSGSYNDLSNKPTIPTIPAKVSAFDNDMGYLTEHQNLEAYALKNEIPDTTKFALKSDIPNINAFLNEAEIQALINATLGVIENGTY